jgi:alkanesulfonate monooxygenase SsuD/methylene tetrahydromethanopterin reductase-like flavin-dependent oxidoreductase (luciferase family)
MIPATRMLPKPLQPGGPPIFGGGRSPAALGRLADGWISYVVTPERYAEGLAQIARAAEAAGRVLASFGTGPLLSAVIDDSHERAWDAATEHRQLERFAQEVRPLLGAAASA